MTIDPRTPVIIGAGQFLHRGDDPTTAPEPVALMAEALRAAEADAGAPGALAGLDAVGVVPVISWGYRDPGRLVAAALGADAPRTTWYPAMGGNTPQMLVTRLARAVADGEADLGAVVGAEAWRTRMRARRAETPLAWTLQADDVAPSAPEADSFALAHPAESACGIRSATDLYACFETALWHASGRSLHDHLAHIGRIWSDYSQVAAANPFAWRREAFTAEEITTPGPGNRMVTFPYTKRMVANPDVDMAAGCIVCSVERARALGVPPERWVFPWSGTDGTDPLTSQRTGFTESPAIRVAGRRALALAGVGIDDVAHLDVYSCFPSAVQIAAAELGIDPHRRLTVYGGLCFAGGPWNNPVSHAIATMVGVLRDQAGTVGLVTANGGSIQKHAFGVYSTDPPPAGFRSERPQAEIDALGSTPVEPDHEGPVRVEAWTVAYDRDGGATRAHAALRTAHGARAWGVTDDPDTMALMASSDVGGAAGELRAGHVLVLS